MSFSAFLKKRHPGFERRSREKTGTQIVNGSRTFSLRENSGKTDARYENSGKTGGEL
jgi:hypothetical protein